MPCSLTQRSGTRIVYRRVRAARANEEPRLTNAPVPEALRVRVVHRDEPGIERTPSGLLQTNAARQYVARDVASDIAHLLDSAARLRFPAPDGTADGERQICAGDIAVLVRTNAQANLIRAALEGARVPAVINGAGSVFSTPSARAWLRLLDAVDRPATPSRARAAALTPFLGWDAHRIATADEEEWDESTGDCIAGIVCSGTPGSLS